MPPYDIPDPFYRLGAAVLAAIAGLAVGLAIALLAMVAGYENARLGISLLGGTVAGFLSGLFLPNAAMDFVQGVMHVFFGAASALVQSSTDEDIDIHNREAPGGLQIVFAFGVIYGLVFLALI